MIQFFINQYKAVNLLVILIIGFGVFTFVAGRKEAFPNIGLDQITISTRYQGASADNVEKLVTEKIENEIDGIDGTKRITSYSSESLSIINFEVDPDVGRANSDILDDIKSAVETITFPDDVDEPVVKELDFATVSPNIVVGFIGEADTEALKQVANRFKADAKKLAGVSKVGLKNYPDLEIWVEVSPQKIQQYELELATVVNAIQAQNINVPAGKINLEGKEFFIRTSKEYQTIEDIQNTIVRGNDSGQYVYLKDIATVRWAHKELLSYRRSQGGESIWLEIFKTPRGDSITVSKAVKDLLETYETNGWLPEGVKTATTDDIAFYVERRLSILSSNATVGLILVFLCMVLFFNLRVTLWTMLGIPFSFCLAIIIAYSIGMTLNLMTMFGLIVVVGMIVDDAIIIAESIYSHVERGVPFYQAAIDGTHEMMVPVVAIIATTTLAFLPLVTLPGIFGDVLGIIPQIIIITLLCSLVECLFVLPGHLAHLKDKRKITPSLARTEPHSGRSEQEVDLLGESDASHHHRAENASNKPSSTFHAVLNKYGWGRTFFHVYTGFYKKLGSVLTSLRQSLTALGQYTGRYVGRYVGQFVRRYATFRKKKQLSSSTLPHPEPHTASLTEPYKSSAYSNGEKSTISATLGAESAVKGVKIVKEQRRWFIAINNLYEKLLERIAKRPITTASLFLVVLLGLAVILGRQIPFVFFPGEAESIFIDIETPTYNSLAATEAVIDEAEINIRKAIGTGDYVINVISTVGQDSTYNDVPNFQSYLGFIRVVLDVSREETDDEISALLENAMKDVPGIDAYKVSLLKGGPPAGKPVDVYVSGDDIENIVNGAEEVYQFMKTLPNTKTHATTYEEGKDEININPNPSLSSQLNIKLTDIANSVRYAFAETSSTTITSLSSFSTNDDEVELIVKYRENEEKVMDDIHSTPVRSQRGLNIPLKNLSEIEFQKSSVRLVKEDGDIFISVNALLKSQKNVEYGANVLNAMLKEKIPEWEAAFPTLNFTIKGEQEEQDELAAGIIKALLLALFGIYFVLTVIFRSYIQPIIIMSIIPLGFIGIIIGLFLTGTPIGLMPFLGGVALMGIVVNDSLVMVDKINRLRRNDRLDVRTAVVQGAKSRMRPILMTSITTIVGIAPLAYGLIGEEPFLAPMAIALMWGLIVSTPLLLILLPSFYLIVDLIMSFIYRIFKKEYTLIETIPLQSRKSS